jgi:protein-disulfide isomerase
VKRANLFAASLALLLAACGASGNAGTPGAGGSTVLKVPVGTSPVDGPADAWVTVVEFSDFQCPYCGAVQPTLRALLPAYGTDVRLVFKHFPLSFHAYARTTAIAAECARAQSRFWELHDLVFAGQAALFGSGAFETNLTAVASRTGLDVANWQACRSDPAMAARVDADLSVGILVGVTGTPSFVVNGSLLVGNRPASDFRGAIDAALARAKASGVPAAQYYDKVILGL